MGHCWFAYIWISWPKKDTVYLPSTFKRRGWTLSILFTFLPRDGFGLVKLVRFAYICACNFVIRLAWQSVCMSSCRGLHGRFLPVLGGKHPWGWAIEGRIAERVTNTARYPIACRVRSWLMSPKTSFWARCVSDRSETNHAFPLTVGRVITLPNKTPILFVIYSAFSLFKTLAASRRHFPGLGTGIWIISHYTRSLNTLDVGLMALN